MSKKKEAHVESQFSIKVMKKLAEDGETFGSFHDVFAYFRSYDPSRSGAYTTWLIKTYCEGGFLFEDLAKAKETLQWFDEFKRRLPVDRRNIADYPTLAEVWKAVKPFVETPEEMEPSKREQRRKEQEEVYKETVFLEETDDFRAVIPLTEKASKWWGRGTRWCTAADQNNMFIDYFKEAPLIVFDFKDGHKWQLYVNDLDTQFMDENDEDIKVTNVDNNWKYIKEYINKALDLNHKFIKYVPLSKLSKERIIELVSGNKKILEEIAIESLSDDIVEKTIELNGDIIWYLNKEKITEKMYDLVKMHYKISDSQENVDIEYLYKKYILLNAEKKYYTGNMATFIKDIEKKDFLSEKAFLDDKFIKDLLSADGGILSYIVNSKKIKDIREGGKLLKEFIEISVNTYGHALRFGKDMRFDPEVYMTAVKNMGTALKYVPQEFKTKELIIAAIKNNGDAISYSEEKSEELYELAFESNPHSFSRFPVEIKTGSLCQTAVERIPRNIAHVPLDMRTIEMCEMALKNEKKYLTEVFISIPRKYFDIEFIKRMVEINPMCYEELAFSDILEYSKEKIDNLSLLYNKVMEQKFKEKTIDNNIGIWEGMRYEIKLEI